MNELSSYSDTYNKPSRWMLFAWCFPVLCGLIAAMLLKHNIYGLPIDDAYIYVKYIQNIADGNGYSFNPNETSFGVTSFAFTIIGAMVKAAIPWLSAVSICQWMSILSFLILLWLAQRIVYGLTGNFTISLAVGAALAFCRPIYFTAPSGLETTFFLMATALTLHIGLKSASSNFLLLGVSCSLCYLARPEGLFFTLIFLGSYVGYPLLFESENVLKVWKRSLTSILTFMAGFMLFAVPYVSFVKWHSGRWMPMTYYGKLLNRSTFTLEPWYGKIKAGVFAIPEAYKQTLVQDITPFTFGLLTLLSVISFAFFLLACGRKTPNARWFSMRVVMFSVFVFPFLYGAAFRASPMFGGYFVRYIQILIVMMHIEGLIGLHHLFKTFANIMQQESRRRNIILSCSILFFPYVIFIGYSDYKRFNRDKDFYSGHVTINEGVRKKAAQWIDQNLEPGARILTSNTGLGVVGAYANRFIRDEAGLINSDIYPFLRGFSEGFNHWHKMMEYMKHLNIDYYTTFPPYGGETRHTETVIELEEPSLKGTNFERLMRIRISKFIAPEEYNLWEDYKDEADLVDRAEQPDVDDRVRLTKWNQQPVIAVRTGADLLDIRQRMIFPSKAHFSTALAFDSQNEFGLEDKVIVEIKVNYGGKLTPVFTKEFPLQGCQRRQPTAEFDVDLAEFNNKFAFLLLGVRAVGPNTQGLWVGWMNPKLQSAK